LQRREKTSLSRRKSEKFVQENDRTGHVKLAADGSGKWKSSVASEECDAEAS